jgi:hypothetical protein
MTDIDKLREALDRIPPMTGKVFISPLPQAEAQSEALADAMVAAMIAGWKRAIEEADRLRAEVERLRAIEAAARAYCDLTPERADETPAPLLFAKLQAAIAAKET